MTSVPLSVETLIWLGSFVLALLIATIVLTMGRSMISARHGVQVDQKRSALRQDVFRYLQSDSTDPDALIAGLTMVERTALREIIEEILLHFRGRNQVQVRHIARALGLERKAFQEFETGERYEQLHALYWFWLLETPIDRDRMIEKSCGDTDTEAAAAQVLLASDDDDIAAPTIELLLSRGQSLSVMGMDALYEIHNDDPTALFAYVANETTDWSESLLIQVFEVISYAAPVGSAVSLEWVIARTSHESADVRAAAFNALSEYGWRDDVRTGVDWERAVRDESAAVRKVVYRVLGRWDDRVNSTAIAALYDDPDDRARVAGVDSLYEDVDREELAPSPQIRKALDWVKLNSAFG